MRTGVYRIRKGIFGKCVLQELMSYPSFVGGQIDGTIRNMEWADVSWRTAPVELSLPFTAMDRAALAKAKEAMG